LNFFGLSRVRSEGKNIKKLRDISDCSGLISAKVVIWLLGLVVAEVSNQSSVVIYGLPVVCISGLSLLLIVVNS
jgi:hypothetical protein